MGSEVGVFGKYRAEFNVLVHGAVQWACEEFEGGAEACVDRRGEVVCDGPLIGYFGHYALWVEEFGAWVVSLHEMC